MRWWPKDRSSSRTERREASARSLRRSPETLRRRDLEGGFVVELSTLWARALFLVLWCVALGYAGSHLVREFRGHALAALFQDAEGLEAAARLLPDEAEVYGELGTIYLLDPTAFDPERAVACFGRAVAVSPWDARLWLGLGRAYEAQGERERAAVAYRRAIALAPQHLRPRWLYANFLLREGDVERALAYLDPVIHATPDLIENVCELVWTAGGEDPTLLLRLTEGRPVWIAVTVSDYLLAKGRYDEAIALWRARFSEDLRLVTALARARQWERADRVWREWIRREYGAEPQEALWNGGFEHPLAPGGLDWRISSSPQVEARIDETAGHEGARSLVLEFRERAGVRYAGVERDVVVEPSTSYVLHFAYRMSGMLPRHGLYVEVEDAEDRHRMRARLVLDRVSEQWSAARLEFTTTAQTRAVRVRIGREPDNALHDYIGGRVWFDAFALERVTHGS